jgi:hypothetical protein
VLCQYLQRPLERTAGSQRADLPGGSNPPWNGFTVTVDAPRTGLSLITFETACDTQDTVWFDDFSVVPVS